ncbi:hypothetical protein NEIPOLOT_00100 [Neisseria polysaccharea ATCC 43768]|nr:hypothetical protein NEIPOLOT_00100 [Neisseria polysaccharea ATCC 43768]
MFPCSWFSDGMKVCRLLFKLFLYYAQLEYNKQGRLKTGLRYCKTDLLVPTSRFGL